MREPTESFSAEFVDRMLLAGQLEGLGEMVLQLEMVFDHPLDLDRLRRAFSLLPLVHPILGCRLMMRHWWPVWVPSDPPDDFRVVDSAESLNSFRVTPFDPFGQPISLCVHTGPDSTHLILRISHLVCDAGGVKETATDLARIYTTLKHDPSHRPSSPEAGSRSSWQTLQHLPLRAHFVAPYRMLRLAFSEVHRRQTRTIPMPSGPRSSFSFSVCHLNEARVKKIADYGKQAGATLNDLFIAAWYCALIKEESNPEQTDLRLMTTVDLRPRYMPEKRSGALCNLSSFEYPFLNRRHPADFHETLRHVMAHMNRAKKGFAGVGQYPFLSPLSLLPFPILRVFVGTMLHNRFFQRRFPAALTNMGIVPPSATDFDRPALRAWLLTPPIYPPIQGAGLSGFNGTLTLSAGLPIDATPVMDRFFNALLEELP